MPETAPIRNPLEAGTLEDAAKRLGVDVTHGLSAAEAAKRLEQYGPNAIEEKRRNPLVQLLSYFWGPIPWMLEVACVLSGVAGRMEDLAVIFAMLLINGAVGWWHESSAARAIEALKETLAPHARVLRDGTRRTVDSRELVPGDVVVVRRGDIVPADARLVGETLSLDESALTGESLPVEKHGGDGIYTGTAVERGESAALVIGTGRATRFGRTVELVAGVHGRSHFQQAVMRIGDFLMVATAAVVLAVIVVGVLRGESFTSVLLFALILTVAGIPVALPAVLSVTMAAGAGRLAERKAIVARLAAMEDLAGISILFSDKTGTLTLNRLELQKPVLIEAGDAAELLLAAALTADRSEERDAMDAAILSAVDSGELEGYHVRRFQPFDSTRKRSEAEVDHDGQTFRVAKGAPQTLLEVGKASPELSERVTRAVDDLAAAGFRALGVIRADNEHWRYLGLLSLLDPPRPDSALVIAEAKQHGVDVRMVTGDHEAIARQVAGQLGLGQRIETAGAWLRGRDEETTTRALQADGFAEVTPEDKYYIVERFQRSGRIVGMTGDGVNDAPALKKADVGFAVSTATEAARAASDIVLTEPGLGVIIAGIEEARRIFERMLSYATFRIAETTRMVIFIAGTVLVLGLYPVTAIMVALLAILNDIPIMTIATDNTPTSREPVRWNMRWVLADASILGLTGVIASFFVLWFARAHLHLALAQLQTLIFLKLLVAGHMTIYVTRVRDWFWRRPWPSWKLLAALESTQAVGTLAAVFGWLVAPIPWSLALGLWAYATSWMFVLSAIRVLALRVLRPRLQPHGTGGAGPGGPRADGPNGAAAPRPAAESMVVGTPA